MRDTAYMRSLREESLHKLFWWSLAVKAAQSAAEAALGVVVMFISTETMLEGAKYLSAFLPGILETMVMSAVHAIAVEGRLFMILYLLSHGIVRLALIIGVYRDKHWAYPALMALLAMFIVSQMVTYSVSHSVVLLVFSVIDAVILWLTWHEYRVHLALKAKMAQRAAEPALQH